MNRAIFAMMAVLLGGISSAWAARVLEQHEDAYELALADVSLPSGVPGSVRFRECRTCRATSLRVTSATTFFLNDTRLEFPDFLEVAAAIRQMDGGAEDTAVYVFFDVESRRVNRLALDHFDG
jgi:hypothetical protein